MKTMKIALTVPNYQNQDWNDQKFSSNRIILIYNYYTYMYVELLSFSNSFLKGPITCKTATPEGSSCMSLERYQVDLFFRYARNLPVSRQSLQIKCKLCQLIDVVRILTMSEIIMCKLICQLIISFPIICCWDVFVISSCYFNNCQWQKHEAMD